MDGQHAQEALRNAALAGRGLHLLIPLLVFTPWPLLILLIWQLGVLPIQLQILILKALTHHLLCAGFRSPCCPGRASCPLHAALGAIQGISDWHTLTFKAMFSANSLTSGSCLDGHHQAPLHWPGSMPHGAEAGRVLPGCRGCCGGWLGSRVSGGPSWGFEGPDRPAEGCRWGSTGAAAAWLQLRGLRGGTCTNLFGRQVCKRWRYGLEACWCAVRLVRI